MIPRGIRNNNPANIRKGDKWQGMSATQTDKAFVQFVSMTWGVRALLKTLKTYVTKHHLHTVEEIISRWAPNNENNTTAYIKTVKAMMSCKYFDPYFDEADFNRPSEKVYLLCNAMTNIESKYVLKYQMYKDAFALM